MVPPLLTVTLCPAGREGPRVCKGRHTEDRPRGGHKHLISRGARVQPEVHCRGQSVHTPTVHTLNIWEPLSCELPLSSTRTPSQPAPLQKLSAPQLAGRDAYTALAQSWRPRPTPEELVQWMPH